MNDYYNYMNRLLRKDTKRNAKKRKIAEALLIKKMKPTLNKQDNSVELKLSS